MERPSGPPGNSEPWISNAEAFSYASGVRFPGWQPGQGRYLARRRLRRMAFWSVAIVGMGVLASAVAAVFLLMSGNRLLAEATDPSRNAQTGLSDGVYTLFDPEVFFGSGRCLYSGNVQASSTASTSLRDVVIVGTSAEQCPPRGAERPSVVAFDVRNGIAVVQRVG